MWLKYLKLWCEVSISTVVVLAGIVPSWANIPKLEAALQERELNQSPIQNNDTLLQAQRPDPNRDRFPQPTPEASPLPQESPVPVPEVSPTPESESTPAPASQTIQVQKIQVTGSTILAAKELNPITQPVEGRAVTIEELRKVADNITQLYLDRGYITSRAILVDQAVQGGVVEIRVIEGSLEDIVVEGTRRLNPSYIRSRVRLGAGKPLNTGKLEDQLRLLRADPLFKNVEASLRAGTQVGQSILVVRVTEAEQFSANLSADNYSPPSIGSERLGLNLGYRNVTGLGDEITASYYRTTRGGADIGDVSYRVPLNAMNGTLQFRAAPNRNKVVQEPFNVFDISGNSQLYELSFRQPFVRSPRQEFALSVGFTYQDGQTFTFAGPTPFGIGPDKDGNSRTRVIKFGQDYVRRDVAGAWSLRSLFSFGLDVLNATSNSGDIPDGDFFSWLGQIQRVQVLSKDNFFIGQLDAQFTPDGLLPSQQFVIGGGQSLRGYRQNVRAGDNGVRFSLEDRQTIIRDEAGNTVMQLAPFFDMGTVWNVASNPNELQSQRFLAGVGIGLLWQALPRLNIRLDYAYPIIDIRDRGDNAQDEAFYFSVNYQL